MAKAKPFNKSPNQKVIQVRKPKARMPFFIVDSRYMHKAMKELTYGGFKLWCYLSENKNGYLFGLSHKAVYESTGMSKSTYDSAIKELKAHGYLVQREDTDVYDFVIDNTFRNGHSMEEWIGWCNETNESKYEWCEEDFDDYENEEYLEYY